VTGAGLIHLAGLKQVGSIYLSGTPFSDADLVHLRDLKELESLGQLPVFDDQFTPAGLCRLVMYLPEYKEYFPFLRKVFLRTGEFTTSSSPFDNETLTASRAAVYLKENVSPDELSADDRLQMATLLLAGEYGVELEYDSDGRVVGVTFSGIPLSSDHLQLLSMLPQLSSVSMNYSREDDSLVETSDLSEPGMDLTGLDLPGMPVLPGEGKSEEVTAFQQSDLARLARISGLKDLHLDGDLFTDDVIEQIVKIKGLHSLHLSTSQITGASLRQLEQLSDLREISFFGCEELTDESLLAIAAMPKIRSVSIGDCKRTSSKGLAGILALPVLETLALYDSAENLDEQALEKLSTSHLKSVILVGELDDSICTRLATISSLEKIAIVSTVFRGEQLEQLKSLARLVNLKLEGCTSLSVEGLRQINQLTGLRKLFLNHSEVSDEEVLQLTDLKQLEFLDLRVNQSLTDTGLAALAAMPKLQELSLFYCPGIRGEGLDHLAMLSELRILDIGNNKIRDVGLQRLSNNRSIWELKLSLNQEFTDAGAIYLGRMKQLKKLELGFTTQLSLDLILKLDAALPGCEITPSQR
jgi:Leucine-rich repeat (LRR) protein